MFAFFRPRLAFMFSIASALALSACSGTGNAVGSQACPVISVVSDTARLVQAPLGSIGNPEDAIFIAEIGDYSGGCSLENDGTLLVVEMTLKIIAERAAKADNVRSVNAPFFVAIANRVDQTILAKEIFNAQFDFKGNQRRVGSQEDILQKIPLLEGKRPGDYEILIGFQLTPEQLRINRLRRGL